MPVASCHDAGTAWSVTVGCGCARYQMVWETADNWLKWHKEWMEGVFSELDAQLLEKRHLQCLKHSHRCVKAFEASGNVGCHAIAK